MNVILASKSPRRKEILEGLGIDFSIVTSDADEGCEEQDPELLVKELAKRKGRAVHDLLSREGKEISDTLIIACDTVVHINGQILGKPKDRCQAVEMLSMLSGKSHHVLSGLYLLYGGKEITRHATTEVIFAPMTAEEIERYVDSNEPYDKAGAYGIQGKASVFIRGIVGDYFNVVGLPVNLLCETLRDEFGVVLG